ncbi:MAG: hypothetical protein ABI389_08355 [Rhodanobacter sp.]
MLAWSEPAAIRLQDGRQVVRIASPKFSCAGQQLAFLTVVSDFAHDRYDASLRVMAASGNTTPVVVQGNARIADAALVAGGRTLAFIAKSGRDKSRSQIYTAATQGGTPTQLSAAPHGVEPFAWDLRGHRLASVTPTTIRSPRRQCHGISGCCRCTAAKQPG